MPALWHRWLQVVFALFILFGIVFAFFGTSSLMAPFSGPIIASFWAGGIPTPETLRFAQFTFGIMGALTVAVGVFGFFMARYALPRGEAWAWVAIVDGLILWYLIDSGLSIYTGAWVNAVFNTGFFLLAAVPVVALWPHMRGRVRRNLQAPAPAA